MDKRPGDAHALLSNALLTETLDTIEREATDRVAAASYSDDDTLRVAAGILRGIRKFREQLRAHLSA